VIEVDALQPLRLPDAPALPPTAVDRLPRGEFGVPELEEDPYWRLAAAFLVECRRAQTRRAYFTELKAWYAWCTKRELHPLAACRHDVALWARQLAEQPRPSSGKVQAPASIARRLSCLSSFYGYGVEVGVLDENPVANVKRPRVAAEAMTVGLAREELEQLLVAAEADSPRSAALITLLAYSGLRVDEALSRDVEHLGHQQGHRVLRISRKGGRDTLEPLSPAVERALDAYLRDRAGGALFVDDHGRRMNEAQAWRLVRRLARKSRPQVSGAAQPAQHAPHVRHQPRRRRRPAAGHPGRHGPRRSTHHPPLHGHPPAP
jgi:integrase/recombinase XerD